MITRNGISTIDDVKLLETVPLQDRHFPSSVLEGIKYGALRNQGRDALVFLPDAAHPSRIFKWSFSELTEKVSQTGAGLKALSERESPVISLLMPNLPETHFALWGAQSVGQVNPINPLLEPEQIADIMRAAGTDILVTLASLPGHDLFDKAIKACRLVSGLQTVVTVNPAHYAVGIKTVLGSISARLKSRAKGLNIVPFADLTKIGHNIELPPRKWNDVGALFHTGGTTSSPKIAQLTHGNQIFISWAAATNRFMEKNKSIFCGLPLFHVNGALVTGLVSWMNGATVFLGPPQGFREQSLLENFWAIIELHRIGALSAVPTVYQKLLEHPVGSHDISSLEFGICGAAPIAKALLDNFQSTTGITLLEGYGFTEGACLSTINPGYGEQRLGSVGLRIPYQEIAIFSESVDGKEFIPAGATQAGLIGVRGPNIFTGYLHADDDAKAWIKWDGKFWYNTGDMGRFDTEGYLWLTGRKKELIIRGGHNIDPALIEGPLNDHPATDLVAAIGSPDPEVGEVPVAYVTLVDGADIQEKQIIKHLQDLIAERAAIPKRIHIINSMPLTALGKIFKPALMGLEIKQVLKNVADQILEGDRASVEVINDVKQGQIIHIAPIHSAFTDDEYRHLKQALDQYALNIIVEKNL